MRTPGGSHPAAANANPAPASRAAHEQGAHPEHGGGEKPESNKGQAGQGAHEHGDGRKDGRKQDTP
jgi:hypothetical protein